jgi:hypothetical protein
MAATTSELLTALTNARNTIRTKLVALGLVAATAKLADCATAIDGIDNNGAVSAQVKEGESYTIPKGYHNGSGTVQGVSGGGNYNTQAKTVTPTKKQQQVTPDAGYYALSGVTVNAIPDNFNDTSAVTATEGDVLATKTIVGADGTTIAGTMPNNGAVEKSLSVTDTSYTVPKGYHSGTGKVSITTETKTATPTEKAQDITPTAGKVLSKVTVTAIPAKYKDVSGVTATADKVLDGAVFVDSTGAAVEGTMVNQGAKKLTIDGLTTLSATIPAGYHNGTGTVSLTDDIRAALAAI